MITIISGTNRGDNNTKKVALEYRRLLSEKNVESAIYALDEIDGTRRTGDFIKAEEGLLQAAENFLLSCPNTTAHIPAY